MTTFIFRSVIAVNCALVLLGALLFVGHNGDSSDVWLTWWLGLIWVALGYTGALKCAAWRGWAGVLVGLLTLPVGLVLAEAAILVSSLWR